LTSKSNFFQIWRRIHNYY